MWWRCSCLPGCFPKAEVLEVMIQWNWSLSTWLHESFGLLNSIHHPSLNFCKFRTDCTDCQQPTSKKIWQKKFHPLPLCKYIRSWVHQDKQLATPIFQVPINMNIYNSPRLAWPFETLLNIFGQHIVRTGLFEAYWTPPSQLSSYKCRTYISEYTTEY